MSPRGLIPQTVCQWLREDPWYGEVVFSAKCGMTTEQILALGRVVERLLVCMSAGISLAFGWDLFRVGVVTDRAAEFAAAGWKANLKRVGPGVFFALFGAAVLAVALRSPLDVA